MRVPFEIGFSMLVTTKPLQVGVNTGSRWYSTGISIAASTGLQVIVNWRMPGGCRLVCLTW